MEARARLRNEVHTVHVKEPLPDEIIIPTFNKASVADWNSADCNNPNPPVVPFYRTRCVFSGFDSEGVALYVEV